MRCERCHKEITDQTDHIYQGRCVPCHRLRPKLRLARILRETWRATRDLVLFPFHIVCGVPGLLSLWFSRYPFTRREIIQALAPLHGEEAARMYFLGLRSGFHWGAGCGLLRPARKRVGRTMQSTVDESY